MSKSAIVVITLLVLLVQLSSAQTMNVEVSGVFSQFGEAENVQLSLPMEPAVGLISRQQIKRSGASALRLHFVVSTPVPTESWALVVRDKKDQPVWSYSATADSSPDIWTGMVPGDVAKVEVIVVKPLPKLKITIDRIIVSKKPTENKSLTANQLTPIEKASPDIQRWGKSVARLIFVRDGGGQFVCTGFLVAADLFMTNNHCVRTPTETNSALAEFDFDYPGATPSTLGFKQLLATNPALDFTLLRLSTSTTRSPFTFDPSSLSDGKALVIIQHPAGKPKHFSIANCKVMGQQVAGVTAALTDFGHGCDTLNGSSGSAALDLVSGKVLGLHHLGFLENAQPVNRAVRIQEIINFLRDPQNLKDAAARLALGLPPL